MGSETQSSGCPDDPELREQLGRAGRVRAHDFTARGVVPKLDAPYRELLSGVGD